MRTADLKYHVSKLNIFLRAQTIIVLNMEEK